MGVEHEQRRESNLQGAFHEGQESKGQIYRKMQDAHYRNIRRGDLMRSIQHWRIAFHGLLI